MSLLDKASLVQIPSGYKEDKLYSVVPDSGAGDFTFARSSSATRVNAEGLIETASVLGSELVTNGDFATDTDWVKAPSGVAISGGSANFNASSDSYVYQDIISVGKTYKVTFSGVVTSGAFYIGENGQAYNIFTQGTYVNQEATFTVLASTRFIIRVNNAPFIGSIDNVSVKEVFENDVPRLDYSGGATCASLLLEPQTQNLVTYSSDFSQWSTLSANAATYISDLVNPDGSVGGYKISGSGIYLGIGLLATTQRSIYARSVSGSGNVQLFTHNSNTNNVFTITEEWQRFDVNSITSGSAVGNYYIDLRGVLSTLTELYVWGAQATNDQSYVTSYIPTDGSTTTRTADVCENAGTSATFNDAEGVLFAEISALADDQTSRGITIDGDGNSENRVLIQYQPSFSNQIRGLLKNDDNSSVELIYVLSDITDNAKIAFKYKSGDLALWVNGVERATSSSAITLSGLQELSFDNGRGDNNFYGKCKQLIYFDQALTDDELETLTTL